MSRFRRTAQPPTGMEISEEALRRQVLMLELSPLLVRDPEDRILYWNRAAEVMFGFTREDAIGRLSHELLQTRFPEPLEQIIGRLRTGRQWQGELRHVCSGGNELIVGTQWIAQMDESGALESIIEVNLDITDRKRVEAERARLAAIVESSDDAIIAKTLEGVITDWNGGAERIFGYPAAEMVGQPVFRIIPAERQAEELEILARLRRGERVEHYETVRIAKDGRRVEVSLTVSPLRDESGTIVGASKIARDITERKRAEEALQQAQASLLTHAEDLERTVAQRTALLHETNSELEAFSSSLAHDMAAPLRAIRNFTELALEETRSKLSAEETGLLQKVLSASERMGRLMNDVMVFSRIARQDLLSKPVDLESLLLDIVSEWPELQPPRADVTLATPLLAVTGQESSLTQCLTNLLGNAVKFVAPGVKPKVRLYTEASGEEVRLWIEDNGIGIAKEARQRIFQGFQRLHGPEQYEGSGLGLAIVRKAVERMGGTVGVESAPGQGSRFWIQLPAAPLPAHGGNH